MIKNLILFAVLSPILFMSGCIKDKSCLGKTIESEEAAMLNFAAANGITAIKHASGLYYQVVSQGSGATPTLASSLSVRYTGKRMDGTQFDQATTPVTFSLANVIAGWQLGLPLINEGGTIRLIIPSSYAYGCEGKGAIAPYSILYFEIELVDVL